MRIFMRIFPIFRYKIEVFSFKTSKHLTYFSLGHMNFLHINQHKYVSLSAYGSHTMNNFQVLKSRYTFFIGNYSCLTVAQFYFYSIQRKSSILKEKVQSEAGKMGSCLSYFIFGQNLKLSNRVDYEKNVYGFVTFKFDFQQFL